MRKATQERWAERVRQWRESGLSAEDFAKGKGYEGTSLRWAASQLQVASASLKEATSSTGTPSRRRAARRAGAPTEPPPQFLPVRARSPRTEAAEMIIEVGDARIRLSRGVDVTLLGEIVRALGGSAR